MSGGRYSKDLFIGYEQKGKTPVFTSTAGQQLNIYNVSLQNRTGVACDMGIYITPNAASWKLGTYDGISGLSIDATSAIQAGTATSVFTTTNNSGFVLQSVDLFGLIGATISQADTVTPVYAFQYWNGSAWTALPAISSTPNYNSATDQWLVFNPPRDWTRGSATGVGQTLIGGQTPYSIFVQASTAPGQAVQFNNLWLGKPLGFMSAIPNTGFIATQYFEERPRQLNTGEGILPYFSVASANNTFQATYFSVN